MKFHNRLHQSYYTNCKRSSNHYRSLGHRHMSCSNNRDYISMRSSMQIKKNLPLWLENITILHYLRLKDFQRMLSKHTLRNNRRPPWFANELLFLPAINRFAHIHQSIEESLTLYWISYYPSNTEFILYFITMLLEANKSHQCNRF